MTYANMSGAGLHELVSGGYVAATPHGAVGGKQPPDVTLSGSAGTRAHISPTSPIPWFFALLILAWLIARRSGLVRRTS
jgi:hypothetical protein